LKEYFVIFPDVPPTLFSPFCLGLHSPPYVAGPLKYSLQIHQTSRGFSSSSSKDEVPPSHSGIVSLSSQYQNNFMNAFMVSSSWQQENIFTIPNLLTTSRIALTPFIGYLVLHQNFHWACSLFVFAGLTDLVSASCYSKIALMLSFTA
jgi:hypothetical protein